MNIDIGSKIKTLRLSKSMTQEQLAKALHVSAQAVSKWENGGSNPDTSFDCSGFVSYVLTNSGLVNTGRLGAQGLYNVCAPVSKANAQPGDLIFFVGTYDTPGVSHVGIYVGDGVMIHCGDPIQYTSINSSYWQQHFYAFGRPAY